MFHKLFFFLALTTCYMTDTNNIYFIQKEHVRIITNEKKAKTDLEQIVNRQVRV